MKTKLEHSKSQKINSSEKAIGKIARLPLHIREQLNRRIYAGEKPKLTLEWLDVLPHVLELIASEFNNRPISKQNLSEWKQHGYRNWRLREEALNFARSVDEDDTSLPKAFTGSLAEKLSRWASLRYAAAVSSLSLQNADPQETLRVLHDLCLDIGTLRRGDLGSARISLEQQRLELEREKSDQEKEAEFWAWTKRPEIQAKLYPHRDPDQIRLEVDRLITERMLGIKRSPKDYVEPEPACYI